MKRIERVYQALMELRQGEKASTSQLAGRLGYSRANVSNDLNRLCEEGKVVKSGTKPVYYQCAGRSTETGGALERFIHMNPSLAACGELAKAAVLYPPHGMHVMLLGETGVGKSYFAELIFRYADAHRRVADGKCLVAFNCADYANNPQLLLGQLFGVTKGAYTGADQDRPGLMERADGGILFLDEIHRLPPEGQEMLFSYIDRGHFRRLGDTEDTRTARVMLVCATTEDPESSLLQTFLRRIPMSIKIPNLEERGLEERLRLITTFFVGESRRLGSPVEVSLNSMRALLGYPCKSNVGQLQTDIQLLCAKAYADFISGKKAGISISSYDLPAHVRDGLHTEKNYKQIWSLLSGITTRFAVFDAVAPTQPFDDASSSGDIYQLLEQRTEDMRRIGKDQAEIDETIQDILDGYYKRYVDAAADNLSNLTHMVGTETVATAGKIISYAGTKLNRNFDDSVRYGLSLHIHNAIKRVLQGRAIINPRLQSIQNNSPDLLKVAQHCLGMIEDDFNVKLPQDEAGFIAMFFTQSDQFPDRRSKVQVIVAAHGEGVATGLAKTANQLLGSACVHGFDVPLEENQELVYDRIRKYLSACPGDKEVLLLVDMEPLADFAYALERDLDVRAKSFLLVSTMHVLEAGRKAQLGYSLYDIYEDIKRVTSLTLSDQASTRNHDLVSKLYLLTVCTTGEGSAQMVNEHLSERLDLKDGLCEIIPLQIINRREFDERVAQLGETGRVIGIVSSFDTGLPVKHFKLSQGLRESGAARIQNHLDTEEMYIRIGQTLAQSLDSLKGGTAMGDIRKSLERMQRLLGIELEREIAIGVFCHMGYMLNRLKRGEPANTFPRRREIAEKYPEELRLIRQECDALGKAHQVKISLDEVCYIIAFFQKEDLLS